MAAAGVAFAVTAAHAGIGGAVAALTLRAEMRDAAISSGFASLDCSDATAAMLGQIVRAAGVAGGPGRRRTQRAAL